MRPIMLALVVLGTSFLECLADEKLVLVSPEDFQAVYRPTLKKLESRYQNYSVRAIHNRSIYEAHVQYRVLGNFFQSTQIYAAEPDKRPDYYPCVHVRMELREGCVTLSRESLTSPYVIVDLSEEESLRRYHRRHNKPIALAATHLFDVSMRMLLDSPDTKITQIHKFQQPDRELWAVHFQADPQVFRWEKVIVNLLPAQDYQIDSYELTYVPKNSETVYYRGSVEYADDQNQKFSVPTQVTIEVQEGTDSPSVFEQAQLSEHAFGQEVQGHFQPSQFELPAQSWDLLKLSPPSQEPTVKVSAEALIGQEIEVSIPVTVDQTPFRVLGTNEEILLCTRVGCGVALQIPQTTLKESAQVLYRFQGKATGTLTLPFQLLTDNPQRPRIPVELIITVKEAEDI